MSEMSEVLGLLRDVSAFLIAIAAMVVLFKIGGLISALSGRIKDGSF